MIPIAKPYIGEEEAKAAREAILSGWVSQGPRVKEFEGCFAEYIGTKHAVAVSSCTTALHLALLAVGVKPGDAVVTVSHSFIATANAVRYCGAEPIFVDIDLETYNMSADSLAQCLSSKHERRLAAILVVHQMGLPCDLGGILPLAKKFNIPVVEDAACAIGSEIKIGAGSFEKIGKPHGDVACFSFHPRKLITTGEGGMVTTDNSETDAKLRLLRHQGMDVSDLARHQSSKIMFEKYPVVGFNYRLSDIHAAVGCVQMKRLPGILKRRKEVALRYCKELGPLSWLKTLKEPDYARTNWQSFPVRVLNDAPMTRDELMQYLLDNGVATRPGIMNAHEEAPYKNSAGTLKSSECARQSVLLLPIFHELSGKEFSTIIQLLKDA